MNMGDFKDEVHYRAPCKERTASCVVFLTQALHRDTPQSTPTLKLTRGAGDWLVRRPSPIFMAVYLIDVV